MEDEYKESNKTYPTIEDLLIKAPITSEAEGYQLLSAIQLLVNSFGATQIISAVNHLRKNPSLIDKAKNYLPYITMLL